MAVAGVSVLYSTLCRRGRKLTTACPWGRISPAGLRRCLTRHPERPVQFCTHHPGGDLPLFGRCRSVGSREEENFADYLALR